eukprot:s204_g27.t1
MSEPADEFDGGKGDHDGLGDYHHGDPSHGAGDGYPVHEPMDEEPGDEEPGHEAADEQPIDGEPEHEDEQPDGEDGEQAPKKPRKIKTEKEIMKHRKSSNKWHDRWVKKGVPKVKDEKNQGDPSGSPEFEIATDMMDKDGVMDLFPTL